jgi:hypothetical protein
VREYRFLNPGTARKIRLGRIQQLEEEHYHALLLAEEDDRDGTAGRAALELERRIDHHVQALTTETAAQDDDPLTVVAAADGIVPAETAGISH